MRKRRGAEASERRGGWGWWCRNTKTTSCFIWVKSRGMIYSRLSVIPPPPFPPLRSTCLSERSEKLEIAQEERAIFSFRYQRHRGLTSKLKIQIYPCTVR